MDMNITAILASGILSAAVSSLIWSSLRPADQSPDIHANEDRGFLSVEEIRVVGSNGETLITIGPCPEKFSPMLAETRTELDDHSSMPIGIWIEAPRGPELFPENSPSRLGILALPEGVAFIAEGPGKGPGNASPRNSRATITAGFLTARMGLDTSMGSIDATTGKGSLPRIILDQMIFGAASNSSPLHAVTRLGHQLTEVGASQGAVGLSFTREPVLPEMKNESNIESMLIEMDVLRPKAASSISAPDGSRVRFQ